MSLQGLASSASWQVGRTAFLRSALVGLKMLIRSE
jgi:hypothetical protein